MRPHRNARQLRFVSARYERGSDSGLNLSHFILPGLRARKVTKDLNDFEV